MRLVQPDNRDITLRLAVQFTRIGTAREVPTHTIPLDISALRRFPGRAGRDRTGHARRA
jgi:hypothetical protein